MYYGQLDGRKESNAKEESRHDVTLGDLPHCPPPYTVRKRMNSYPALIKANQAISPHEVQRQQILVSAEAKHTENSHIPNQDS